jgi:GT2 family glycosyltransferase
MLVSVIVPVYNNSKDLHECLSALIASSCRDTEILVVDDASTDETPSVGLRMGVRVLRLAKNSGPAAARNCGAAHARGDVLFFVDADVVLSPDAIQHVSLLFEVQPDLAAVFGSYDAAPRAEGIISQYRNLLHHFVHQNGNPEASSFWAGCGAIRRSVFEQVGGFDEKRFSRPSIEDIEFGYRLRQAGYRIFLDKELQGTHLKRWSLWSLIRTDVACRAIPWSRLILESKKAPHDLNLKMGQRASAALVGVACASVLFAAARPEFLLLSIVTLLGVVLLNRKLYAFFLRRHGIFFAVACLPLHLLYFLYSGISYLYVRAEFAVRSLREVGRVRTAKMRASLPRIEKS